MDEEVAWEELSSEKKKFDRSLVLLWNWARKNRDYNYYPDGDSIGSAVEMLYNYYPDGDSIGSAVEMLPLSLSSGESTESDDVYFAPMSQEAFVAWAPTRPVHTWSSHKPQLKDCGVTKRRFYNRSSMFEVINALELNIGSKLHE